jgi:hypothetical protein
MKKAILNTLAITAIVSLVSVNGFAASPAKDKTVTGIGKCAKCSLKETDACQNVIEVKKGNKTVSYYLVQNDVSKEFHKNISKENKKVKATFSVTEENGKKIYTAKKIDVVKEN